MDTVMRIWIFACILLFSMRQFLPQLDRRIDVVGLFGIAFVLLVASAAGTALYRRYKEAMQHRSLEHRG